MTWDTRSFPPRTWARLLPRLKDDRRPSAVEAARCIRFQLARHAHEERIEIAMTKPAMAIVNHLVEEGRTAVIMRR